MKSIKIICLITLMSFITSCNMTKQNMGTVLGGVGGALIGSQIGGGSGSIAAIAIGAVAGASLGNHIGSSLDQADKRYYQTASYTTLESTPTGRSQTWKNPDTGNWGTFTPTKTFQNSEGTYCREFSQKIVVGGKVQEGYGTACRQPDGDWKIVN